MKISLPTTILLLIRPDQHVLRIKGNVESGVKIITNRAMLKLAGRDFTNLDDLNATLQDAVEGINNRTPFRNQSLSRREIFLDAEKDLLAQAIKYIFCGNGMGKAKVAPNWHITVNYVHYSIQCQHVGLTVDVRICGHQLDVLTGGSIITTHNVGTQRGMYVTDIAHCPPGTGCLGFRFPVFPST